MDIIGYATFYIKLEYADAKPDYCKYEFDFRKPLGKNFLKELLKDTAVVFQRMGKNPICISYTTKEEYDASETKPQLIHEWNTDEDGKVTEQTTME